MVANNEIWTCGKCGQKNDALRNRCGACAEPRAAVLSSTIFESDEQAEPQEVAANGTIWDSVIVSTTVVVVGLFVTRAGEGYSALYWIIAGPATLAMLFRAIGARLGGKAQSTPQKLGTFFATAGIMLVILPLIALAIVAALVISLLVFCGSMMK